MHNDHIVPNHQYPYAIRNTNLGYALISTEGDLKGGPNIKAHLSRGSKCWQNRMAGIYVVDLLAI